MKVELTHRILSTRVTPDTLIEPAADRPGHDRRHSLDTTKRRALGWASEVPFEEGLAATVDWYRPHEWWWRPLEEQDPAFRADYQAQCVQRRR